MYEKLIGSKVKIVLRDGDKVSVYKGTILDYKSDIKTIELYNFKNHTRVFLNVLSIDKLQPLEERGDSFDN